MAWPCWAILYIAVLLSLFEGCQSDPNAPCYYLGGTPALLFKPCDRFAFTTVCCPLGWTCYSSDLCILTHPNATTPDTPVGTTLRGTCTNPLWNNTACGDFCLDKGSSGELTDCGNDNYCCRTLELNGSCNCTTGKGTFHRARGTPTTIIGFTGLSYATLPTATPTNSSTTSSPRPTTVFITTTLAVTVTNQAPTSPPASSPTSTGQADSTPITKTTRFKVGVGVGSAAAFCLAIVLLTWFFRRRNERRKSHVETHVQSLQPLPEITTFGGDTFQAWPYGPADVPEGIAGRRPSIDDAAQAEFGMRPLSSNPPAFNAPAPIIWRDFIDPPGRAANLRPIPEVSEPHSGASSPRTQDTFARGEISPTESAISPRDVR